jgi:hypothetical protein
MTVLGSPGPEGDNAEYWRDLAEEARRREQAEILTKSQQTRRAHEIAREKADNAFDAWSAAVVRRDRQRRMVGLVLAAVGAVAGLLLLFWASRVHGFWDALGTAMLVTATVEAAARLVGKMISTTEGRVSDEWRSYLTQISTDVSAISADLMNESMERAASKEDAKYVADAKLKASLADGYDRTMAKPSRSPTDERLLESITRTMAAVPSVPDSYYYSARADLLAGRERDRLRRLVHDADPDSSGGPHEDAE